MGNEIKEQLKFYPPGVQKNQINIFYVCKSLLRLRGGKEGTVANLLDIC